MSTSNPTNSFVNPFTDFVKKSKMFAHLFLEHLRVHWFSYVLIWALWTVCSANYILAVNETPSLPQKIFYVHKHQPVHKGDYAAFTVPPDAAKNFKNPNAILTKIVVGIEGDTVSVKNRLVYVNGTPVGIAKERSLKNEELFPIAQTKIPPGMFYVMGLHRDSLDSRYTIVGLVPQSSIVGRAFPLF